MLSDLLYVGIIGLFIAYGLRKTYILMCGVIWVDVFRPQMMSYSFLAGKPVSLIITLLFLISVVFNWKEIKFSKHVNSILPILMFMIWITVTTVYSLYPELAWLKYDIAIKVLFFAIFIPVFLDTRIKLEFFVWTLVITLSYFFLSVGLKTMNGGGGYGNTLISGNSGNSGLGEGSTLSVVAISFIPMSFYLLNNSLIVKENKWLCYFLKCLIVLSVVAVLGTYARSGLVAAAVLVILYFIQSKNKIKVLSGVFVLALFSLPFVSQQWLERMNTISSANEEGSALGRIVVWRWTIDFANEHPILGGGFYSYLANKGQLQDYTEGVEKFETNPKGKAFHSVIFEVLGEHGYVGLTILGVIIFNALSMNRKVKKNFQYDDWQYQLSVCLTMSFLAFMTGALFIGVLFEPWIYYFYAMSASLGSVAFRRKVGN